MIARCFTHASSSPCHAVSCGATRIGQATLMALVILLLLLSQGCAVNPVTGERELMLISESQEHSIGQEQYKPAQQSQGGRYLLDPELTFYVSTVGKKLAAVSDRPDLPYEFVVLNNSTPNAWALPSGKIAINRGLIARLEDEAQLAAVLGHEIVHAAARHSAKRLQSNMMISAGVAMAGMALGDKEYGDLLVGGAALGATLALAKYGRDHELESDFYGIEYMAKAGYDPQAAVDLQRLFVELSKGRSNSWMEGLLASHPPSQERVERNIRTAQMYPNATYRGREAYLQATQRVRRTVPAYDAFEEAGKAFKNKQYYKAMDAINKAIRIEPEEGGFYSLRGDIYKAQGKEALAMKDFDKAVRLSPDHFATHLNRGLALKEKGQLNAAIRDLKSANNLLETSVAYLALGDIASSRDNTDNALQYYAVAAQAKGSLGSEARQKLSRLDLPRNPDKYLKVRPVKDNQGRVFLRLENHSALDLRQVTVTVALVNAAGWVLQQEEIRFRSVKANSQSSPLFNRIATQAANSKEARMITKVSDFRQ